MINKFVIFKDTNLKFSSNVHFQIWKQSYFRHHARILIIQLFLDILLKIPKKINCKNCMALTISAKY